MAHELQDRYSKLVDAKLRATLVKKDGVIFNPQYCQTYAHWRRRGNISCSS